MRLALLALLALLILPAAAIRADEAADLKAEVAQAKPLALDIVLAETDYILEETVDEKTGKTLPVITDNLYEHSVRKKISLATDDIGHLVMPGEADVIYRIQPTDTGDHRLTVLVRSYLAGRKDLVKTLDLPLDEWAVHSFLSYKTSWGDQRYYYVVVRLGEAGKPTPLAAYKWK